jgi:hypothetical protein
MAMPAANPMEKFVRALLKTLGRLIQEKAHAEIIIVVRDGKVQLVRENRTFLPENLPE